MDALSPDKRYCKIRKRKTRKCLNEIRTRCQQGGDINTDIKVTKKATQRATAATRNRPNILKGTSSNITKKRLTIQHGIFAKGVRSETISRRELSEEVRARMDENLHKIIDLANGQPVHTLTSVDNETHTNQPSSDMEFEVNLLNRSNKDIFNNYKTVPFSVHKNVGVTSNSSSSSLPEVSSCNVNEGHKSPLCITPPNKNIPAEERSSNVTIGKIVLNTTLSDSDMDEKHYELYKEFNEMLPSYLNKYLPIENAERIEHGLKSYLQAVYKKSCLRESEENILGCITNRQKKSSDLCRNPKSILQETMKKSVILNPIEYLKQVQHFESANNAIHKRDIPQNSHNLDNTSSTCRKIMKLDEPGCSHYGNEVFIPLNSPVHQILQLSLSSDSNDEQNDNTSTKRPVFEQSKTHADNDLTTILGDESPEYTYYPRKII